MRGLMLITYAYERLAHYSRPKNSFKFVTDSILWVPEMDRIQPLRVMRYDWAERVGRFSRLNNPQLLFILSPMGDGDR